MLGNEEKYENVVYLHVSLPFSINKTIKTRRPLHIASEKKGYAVYKIHYINLLKDIYFITDLP